MRIGFFSPGSVLPLTITIFYFAQKQNQEHYLQHHIKILFYWFSEIENVVLPHGREKFRDGEERQLVVITHTVISALSTQK